MPCVLYLDSLLSGWCLWLLVLRPWGPFVHHILEHSIWRRLLKSGFCPVGYLFYLPGKASGAKQSSERDGNMSRPYEKNTCINNFINIFWTIYNSPFLHSFVFYTMHCMYSFCICSIIYSFYNLLFYIICGRYLYTFIWSLWGYVFISLFCLLFEKGIM